MSAAGIVVNKIHLNLIARNTFSPEAIPGANAKLSDIQNVDYIFVTDLPLTERTERELAMTAMKIKTALERKFNLLLMRPRLMINYLRSVITFTVSARSEHFLPFLIELEIIEKRKKTYGKHHED